MPVLLRSPGSALEGPGRSQPRCPTPRRRAGCECSLEQPEHWHPTQCTAAVRLAGCRSKRRIFCQWQVSHRSWLMPNEPGRHGESRSSSGGPPLLRACPAVAVTRMIHPSPSNVAENCQKCAFQNKKNMKTRMPVILLATKRFGEHEARQEKVRFKGVSLQAGSLPQRRPGAL